ncbi:MAG: tRNA 2-thiouridine(34) synthase MnmA [Patescibacteria group bacterium]|nr:tRNA 2-thiouridine(34) synthase MnmA [Patescibacteria group bacterium]
MAVKNKNTKKKAKVFVGLSGGVDSSVAAALLQKQGFDVTGVFIKVWQPPFLPCTWREERRDAMRVAAHLGIPFYTFDFEKEYKKEVVDYMVGEYKEGRVPNPDVMCNKNIKFGAFLDKALAMGADFIAMGHYARIKQVAGGKHALLKGIDEDKDQSYFLWTLTEEELCRTLFPIGAYEKKDVRALAKKFGLPTAQKKDSQGLCFIGKVEMKDFLKHYIDEKPGDVVDTKGVVIGRHEGSWFYTIGQRHGFHITKKSTHELPYYVVEKNVQANTVTVAHQQIEEGFAKKEVALKEVNWNEAPKKEKHFTAKTRYRQTAQKCKMLFLGNETQVVFDVPQNVAAGQSLVLYDGEQCLGGGIIG